jgi:tRNA(Ile)-lysidine synthase TilS/MesJ
LACPRQELEEWLQDRALPWRHDPSNDDLRFARNRLRHVMLPALEELGPGWRRRAQESLEDLGAAWDWMQAQAVAVAGRAARGGSLDRAALTELPHLLLRTVLQIWLEEQGIQNLRREHLEEVARLARNGQNGQMCLLPGAVRCQLELQRLVLAVAQVPEKT